jgi:hypothetical protein
LEVAAVNEHSSVFLILEIERPRDLTDNNLACGATVFLQQTTTTTKSTGGLLLQVLLQKREMPQSYCNTIDFNDLYLPPCRYDFVWAQSMKTYLEMMDSEGWTSQKSFSVLSLNPFISKVSLYIYKTYLTITNMIV